MSAHSAGHTGPPVLVSVVDPLVDPLVDPPVDPLVPVLVSVPPLDEPDAVPSLSLTPPDDDDDDEPSVVPTVAVPAVLVAPVPLPPSSPLHAAPATSNPTPIQATFLSIPSPRRQDSGPPEAPPSSADHPRSGENATRPRDLDRRATSSILTATPADAAGRS